MIVKSILPVWFKDRIKAKLRIWLDKDLPERFYCPACGSKHKAFKAFDIRTYLDKGFIYSLSDLETFNISAYSCPICKSSDRDRLYVGFWEGELLAQKLNQIKQFLDFAPTPMFSERIKQIPGIAYRSADLYMDTVDDKVDIQDMNMYADESFDYFHCSHVLEHVPDDIKAVKELFRILKRGGKGVIMVPIIKTMDEKVEDLSLTDPDLRWKHFGQDDHVRIYGKASFVKLLIDCGFTVKEIQGRDLFKPQPYLYGIDADSVLYVVSK